MHLAVCLIVCTELTAFRRTHREVALVTVKRMTYMIADNERDDAAASVARVVAN